MGSIPFAFSVHHFINSVGADAGFASIIGLALLVLLYFAQARETSSLREQAYEAAQRVEQLEGRLAQVARQQASSVVPAPAPAVHPTSARPLTNPIAAAAPAAPAGVGAPALTAATRLIPAGTGYPAPQPAVAAAGPGPDRPAGATAVVAPPPATVAGGANGTAQEQVQAPPVAAGMPPAGPPPRVQIRPGGAAAAGRRPPTAPRGRPRREGSGRGRRAIVVMFLALAVAAVVVGLLALTSGGSTPKKVSSSSGKPSNAPVTHRHHAKPAAPSPSSITVAVLNGTATSGLAHRVALRLGAVGYKQGTVATAADQTRTSTVVAYLPGHKADATAVAASLKLGPASVQALDPTTQQVACPQASACAATDVVVTVGSDLANTP